MFRLFICLLCLTFSLQAQELNCTVVINIEQLNTAAIGVDKQIFTTMRTAITDFINTRRWTSDAFQVEERINCLLTINLTEAPEVGSFQGNAIFIVNRPIYGTSYETPLLKFVDKQFNFKYLPSQPMDYNENNYVSNLTSMLAFYAQIALAVDYDSFSKFGGNAFIQKAYQIATNAQSGGDAGWKQFDDSRNRFSLIENLNNQQMRGFREGLYNYHFLGLDVFLTQPAQVRQRILGVLGMLKQVNQLRPSSLILNNFFEVKADEIVQIFSQAEPAEKQMVYNILTNIDPPRTENYQQLLR